jgi:ABC-type multidrug transport system fused ATPase/permease subunit
MQFSPILAAVLIGAYIVVAGQMVLDEVVSLGAFIVTIDMYQRISWSWERIYQTVLTIHSCLPSLELVFWHMNLPTDLESRRRMLITNRSMGVEERSKAREAQKPADVLYAIDMLPIKLRGVSYLYREFKVSSLASEVSNNLKSNKPMFHVRESVGLLNDVADPPGVTEVNLDIEQGTLVALVGRRGQGKTTLLKTLGGVLIPEGDLYMPTHLRVVHVMASPVFFQSTLLDNLRYGISAINVEYGNIERILKICRKMRISEPLIKTIIDEEMHQWSEHLSLTQKASLHLARAIICNPDVLVVHKPMLVFDSTTAKAVMECLAEFVKNRGLFVEGDFRLRRRKTCIITATRLEGIKVCDKCFNVSKFGVKEIHKDDITAEMVS